MSSFTFKNFDASRVPSPCFVVDEVAVEQNLNRLKYVCDQSGARCLLALKAFSLFALAPLVSRYLHGTCASGLHEAKLGSEEYGGECHVYCAAFTDDDFRSVATFADHVVFNSFNQSNRFAECISPTAKPKAGLRVNPLHSEGANPIYDPCSPGSRLGIPITEIAALSADDDVFKHISGLHFHTLCEQGFGPLDRTLSVIEEKLSPLLESMQWINYGGGHHITQNDYDVERLIKRIVKFRQRFGVQVYLEPGEAIAINTGVLVSTVLDVTRNSMDLAILDTSATCHMPDTLEMPYRAEIFGAGDVNDKAHTYRLGGQTCLAGDVMGDYSFDEPLERGQRLMFDDMSHYTMVKTSTFNGINLPSIAVWNSGNNELRVVKKFGYEDFKQRLS